MWVWLPKGEGLPVTELVLGPTTWLLWAVALLPEAQHFSPSREKIKNAQSCNFIAICAFVATRWHWCFWNSFENYRNVLSAVVPPYWAACIRLWRRKQSVHAKYWKLKLCFVCSQLDAGQGNTSPWLRSCGVSVRRQLLYKKVRFKNKFSFHRFYILLDFTFVLMAPSGR